MADVKISALPAATAPLAGTEVLPIVQSSTTKQVAVADLTAGRAISATSLTLTTPLAVTSGGTGLTSLTAGYIPFGNGTGAFSSSSGLYFDGTNLGVGTSTIVQKLTVNGSVYVPDGYAYTFGSSASYISGNSASNFINFVTSSSERMRLDASGNLGIGTSSPSTKLDVTGMIRASDALISNNGTVNTRIVSFGSASFIGTTSNHPVLFQTNDAERMRLDTAGNLGLGVTPSAWWSGSKAIQIGLGGFIQGRTSTSAAVEIGANQYINTSVQRTYIANGAASYYEQTGGAHQWFTAASGTAGNAISFTQVMTLDASGNLGVGVASPSYIVQAAAAVSGYWNSSSAWVGTPAALSISNTLNGGYDAAIIFQQTDSGGTTKLSGGIGLVGTSGWTAGNNSTQISDMYFAVKNSSGGISERVRITSSGELLVGTTSASFSSTNYGIVLKPNAETFWITNTPGNIIAFNRNSDGGIFKFFRSGTEVGSVTVTTTATTYGTSSDISLKEKISDASSALSSILSMPIRQFDWKADGSHTDYGVIAQEANEFAPEIVAKKDIWQVDYGRITPRLIKAFQELAAEVAALKGQLNG